MDDETEKSNDKIWEQIPVPFKWCASKDSVLHLQICAQKVSLATQRGESVEAWVALPQIATLSFYRTAILKLRNAHRAMLAAEAARDLVGAHEILRGAIVDLNSEEPCVSPDVRSYRRDGVQCSKEEYWALMESPSYRQVASTTIGLGTTHEQRISTEWIGRDPEQGDAAIPKIFRTITINGDGPSPTYREEGRYTTVADAIDGHRAVVKRLGEAVVKRLGEDS